MVSGLLADNRRSTRTGRGDVVAGLRRQACPECTGIVGSGSGGLSLPIDEPKFGDSRGDSSQVTGKPLASVKQSIRSLSAMISRIIVATLAHFLIAAEASAQHLQESECGLLIHAREGQGFAPVPQGDIFCPLIADPKETRSFVAYQRGKSPDQPLTIPEQNQVTLAPFDTDIANVGVGDAIGLARWSGARPGDGVQLSLAAGVFAQFDLATSSFDLINADYVIGLPLTFRRSGFSGRLRLYHQSSHLGDEFLLSADPERINLSFESAELILSQAFGGLRVYGGGEFFFNRDPSDLDPLLAHGGAE